MRNRTETNLLRFVEKLKVRLKLLESVSLRFSRVRFGVATIGAVATILTYQTAGKLAWIVATIAIVVFSTIVYCHNRVILSIRKHRYYADIKSRHISRIRRDWDQLLAPPLDEASPEHPFARDLNLVGPRSLHHLVDTAFTQEGSKRLRDWLTRVSPDLAATEEQQELIKDLVPLSRFRDRITLLSALVTRTPGERWQGDVLINWLKNHVEVGRVKLVLAVLGFLAMLTPSLLALQLVVGIPSWWALSLTAYLGIYLLNFRLYAHLFDEAEHLYFQLNRFRPVLVFLEDYNFKSETRLASVAAPFQEGDRRPSEYLKTVMWLSVAASAQKNDILRVVLNLLVPWELFFAFVLDRYKKQLEDRLPQWLDSLQQIEAASSLATFAALNPGCSFAEFHRGTTDVDGATTGPVFEALDLGHPLLTDKSKIRNSYEVGHNGELALVTGSNMSGKSTFLRTIGTNLCLALAGGPVDARMLRTVPFRLFTCINVSDSVNDGISYFYAEVKRLKRLLVELERESPQPLFFLIDEIFRGTNNRERFIGSRALLLSLRHENGTGIVSTHDLELVKLESEVDSVHNFHFREHVEDGRMVFDYLLRPGPCPTTNALKIMKMEGLPIDDVL